MINQTKDFVYLGESVNHNAGLSIGQRIRNVRCSFPNFTLKLYGRPSDPLKLKIRMPRAKVLETMLYNCVT